MTRGHRLASREAAHSAPSRRARSQAGRRMWGSGYPEKRKDGLGGQGHFSVNTQHFCDHVGGNSSRRKQPKSLNSVIPGAGENQQALAKRDVFSLEANTPSSPGRKSTAPGSPQWGWKVR